MARKEEEEVIGKNKEIIVNSSLILYSRLLRQKLEIFPEKVFYQPTANQCGLKYTWGTHDFQLIFI